MPAYGTRPGGVTNGSSVPTSVRSNSAIDLQAANRAVRNIRGGYVAPLRKLVCFKKNTATCLIFNFVERAALHQ